MSATTYAALASPENQRGVAGWLLFFCIVFTIVLPAWTLTNYALLVFRLSHSSVGHFPFQPLMLAGWFRGGLGMLAGILLWRERRSAIPALQIYYGLGVLLTLASVYSWVRILSRFGAGHVAYMFFPLVTGFILPMVLLVVGIIYFSFSARVRATYGKNLLPLAS